MYTSNKSWCTYTYIKSPWLLMKAKLNIYKNPHFHILSNWKWRQIFIYLSLSISFTHFWQFCCSSISILQFYEPPSMHLRHTPPSPTKYRYCASMVKSCSSWKYLSSLPFFKFLSSLPLYCPSLVHVHWTGIVYRSYLTHRLDFSCTIWKPKSKYSNSLILI